MSYNIFPSLIYFTLYDILYMQNLERNELVYKTETDSENELMVVRREECREGIVKEFGMDVYTLL